MTKTTRGRRRGTIAPKFIGTNKGGNRRQVLNQWVVRIAQGKDPSTGKYVRVNKVVHGTKGDAEQVLTELLQRKDQRIPIPRGRITLWAWLEESLALWSDRLAPQTILRMRETFARYIPPELRGRRLDALSAEDFQRLYQGMQQRGLSSTTVAYLHRAVRSQLNLAVKLGRLARSPLIGVTSPRPEHRERRTLSQDEARAFLAALEAERLGAFFGLMLLVGLRPEEALGLRWEDLDGPLLQVRRALVWLKASPWSLEPTKGKRSRVVRLPELAQRLLQRHRARQAAERLKAGDAYGELGLVFATEIGTPLRWSNVSRVFRALRGRIGLPRIRPYDLRHTAATLMLKSGSHPKEVAEALGHANIQITLDTYSHVTPDMQERAAARMDDYLAPRAVALA